LKRPITRVGERLILGELITWPSLEPGVKEKDQRYPYLQRLTRREERNSLAGAITAFLRKLELKRLDGDELDVVDSFVSYIYDTYGLPREGCVPQVTRTSLGFVPIYERRFIGLDPIENTLSRHFQTIASLPKRGKLVFECSMLDDKIFECNGNGLLKHLTALGYLEQEKMNILVYGKYGLKQLLLEYTHPEPMIYQYTVVQQLPVWAKEVIA
jgi:hypothetical protein